MKNENKGRHKTHPQAPKWPFPPKPSESYSVLLEGSSRGASGSLCLLYNPMSQSLDAINVVAIHGRGSRLLQEMGTLA